MYINLVGGVYCIFVTFPCGILGTFFYFVSYLVCIHLSEEERAGYFVLTFFCRVTVNILWFFLTVPWVGLQCAIVVFLIILTYVLLALNIIIKIIRNKSVRIIMSLRIKIGILLTIEIKTHKLLHLV